MSNSLAIAAVTAIISRLLEKGVKLNDDGTADQDLTDLAVTTLPPSKARGTRTSNQINLFLYQTVPNATFKNMNLPLVRSGETGIPPLALNLNYLITAFGKNDDDILSHRLLGRAMRILNDFPLAGASSLFTSGEVKGLLSGSGVDMQLEKVRITSLPLTLDEMSKLWTMFQTEYRITAAYQASVVLIESTQPVKSSLPVLKRGASDEGAAVQASHIPILTHIQPSGSMPSATLGTDITICGQYMDTDNIRVRFSSRLISSPIERNPLPEIQPDHIVFHLASLNEDSDAYVTWMPGFLTVSLVIRQPGKPVMTTNEVSMTLAPVITVSPAEAPAGDVTLTITCIPRVRDGQHVVLLFGNSQIPVQTCNSPIDKSEPTTLTFLVKNAKPGSYLIRLRVDGVDSLPFNVTGTPPMIDFDPQKKVTIT